ncbi:uncharacterized protein LOC128211070 [Mya arenaria]|uniref:uncharacterized protein LOC128211070 n=1 Tax=Mya arenaria TaxID=6604 RepID=UPI0022E53A86|nr:uncharacterized protein LOC128211070 [Mya arenaria]XP_052771434.1 uncharacterized protein LOC128211070 [Mya arenaria]XP_052771435.1 uncharacterized protein LOC128211070 [Mya arenaria]XP_052771436.1 uncharacterized protein LOC128211070 [Mya arenaria]XP_052771437.1 uncharacterized protein LOC128211070 [Mya arenaria]
MVNAGDRCNFFRRRVVLKTVVVLCLLTYVFIELLYVVKDKREKGDTIHVVDYNDTFKFKPLSNGRIAPFGVDRNDFKRFPYIMGEAERMLRTLKDLDKVNFLKELLNSSDVSGKQYSGRIIRKFSTNKIKFRFKRVKAHKTADNADDTESEFMHKSCKMWAVLTTIFEPPSEAVRRFKYMRNWCVVIAGDAGLPNTYLLPSSVPNQTIVFLSKEDQNRIHSDFIDGLPWKSFGRKNVGFLYAIAHGAKIIWDCDDDNMLKFWLEGASPDDNLWIETYTNIDGTLKPLTLVDVKEKYKNDIANFFNPYPYLGAPNPSCWPRGYPLTLIRSSEGMDHLTFKNVSNVKSAAKHVGVLQALADHEPDVDALYRLIHGTPFYFKRPKSENDKKSAVLLSPGVYSPLNAQATLHFHSAFIAMYLPTTVHGRVSDIWRSYIAQAVLSLKDILVGFMPRPLVDQDRNVHSHLADLQSETPLYTRVEVFVSFLDHWRRDKIAKGEHKSRSFEDLYEDLYIGIYERGFIEIDDVLAIQRWILALFGVGFTTRSIDTLADSASDWIISEDKSNFNVGLSVFYQPNSFPKSCEVVKKKHTEMTFWTSDLHDGCRIDFPTILSSLGQRSVVAGYKYRKTPYPEVFNISNIIVPKSIPKEIEDYRIGTQVTQDLINKVMQFYTNDELFQSVDAFFCGFYSSMCQLWMPLNNTKSILFITAHRYNLGRCTVDSWNKLTDQLIDLELRNVQSRTGAKHIIGGASRYDYEYLKYYTGLGDAIKLISSFGGMYTKGGEFKPSEAEILVAGYDKTMIGKVKSFKLIDIHEKYKHYTSNDLLRHKAIIYIPYSVMSYKLTDFYSINIPLFMPSAKFLRSRGGLGADRTSTTSPYCNMDTDLHLKVSKHPTSHHSYNPNAEFNDDVEAEMYWLQFSDFFDWPHILYFDSIEDLDTKLNTVDFSTVSNLMRTENDIRKHLVLSQWCSIISSIRH